jgi:hypothetical protein
MAKRQDETPQQQEPQRQAGDAQDEELRHKGPDRSTPEEQHSGPRPEGNGGTGAPAAFPPHN